MLSLGLSLLKHLSGVTWLAKDLVWLLPDASCGQVEATQAWVDKYTSAVGGGVFCGVKLPATGALTFKLLLCCY